MSEVKKGKPLSQKNKDGISKSLKLYFQLHPRKKKEIKNLTDYRNRCQFHFDVYDYPDEFDFDIIRKYGWYSAINRGGNTCGVSRDHCISVTYGFENNIDPNIIGHPANCKLMTNSENQSKHKKCSMTIDELNHKILSWDEKYLKIE